MTSSTPPLYSQGFVSAKLLLFVQSELRCAKTILLDLLCMTTYTFANESEVCKNKESDWQAGTIPCFYNEATIPYQTIYALKMLRLFQVKLRKDTISL